MPSITNLVTKTSLNAKINKVKKEIPTIPGKIFNTNFSFYVKWHTM